MPRKRTAAAQPQAEPVETATITPPEVTAAAQPQADAPWQLAYVGEVESVRVCGYDLPRGVATPVPEAVARRFANHPSFEVSGGDVHAG